jgi:hypothetical protein
MSALLKGALCQGILSAHSKLGDVYVVSQDRRYFVCHRIVLISASEVMAQVLSTTCDFCEEITDENVVVFLEGIPGDILHSFLSLVYTGKQYSD